MNRKTFIGSLLSAVGLTLKSKEIAVSAGGGGNDRLIGSGNLKIHNYDLPINGFYVTPSHKNMNMYDSYLDRSVNIPGVRLTDEQKETLLNGSWI